MGIRESIDASSDLAFVDVPVPEWGVTVRLREPDTDDIVEIERLADEWKTENEGRKMPTLVTAPQNVAVIMRDPATGERIYQPSEWPVLAKRSPKVVVRLYVAASKVIQKGDIAGESGAVPSGASSSV